MGAWRRDASYAGGPSWPACDTLDDATLVVRAREGDITAFEALVRRYRVPVYRIAVRILTDPASAADTAQEAFIGDDRDTCETGHGLMLMCPAGA